MPRFGRRAAGLLFAMLCALPWAAKAQAPPDTEPGWHMVRPGDTLEAIAKRYLGSERLWPLFARLNPEIRDPNRLVPGQRIQIFVPRGTSSAAQLSRLARRVETLPRPIPWSTAQLGDLLVERDGLRTYPRSSAEMEFLDGTRLRVTEDSLVFLQQVRGTLRGVERKSVEIVEGQADVEALRRPDAAAQPRPEVEIVLGASRTTARPDAAGVARSRARKAEEGGARIMIYGGEGEVEAGGAKVRVPEGMGTAVAATGPPAPPEKLLPTPLAVQPAPGAEVACANPMLSWQPVPEAASYTVEVCSDPTCGALVERATGLAGTSWRPATLPVGELFWRATARSRSGLDGYPGEPVKIAITSDQVDLEPPSGTLSLSGPQVLVGEILFAGPEARPEVAVEDAGSGVARWLPVVQGQESEGTFAQLPAGPLEIGAVAVDRCGNRGSLAPISFTVDNTPPELPWEVTEYRAFEGFRTPRGKRGRTGPIALSGGVRWTTDLPLEPLRVEADLPRLYIHAPGAQITAEGRQVVLEAGQMLSVLAEDTGARIAWASVQARQDGQRITLQVEAADLVGNVRKESWLIELP